MLSTIIYLVRFCQISDVANENRKLPFQITLDIQMKISPLSQNPLEIKRIEPLSGCFFARLFDYSIEMRPRESRIRKYSFFYVFLGKRSSLYAAFNFVDLSFFSGYHTHKEQRRTYRGKNGRKEVLILLIFYCSS